MINAGIYQNNKNKIYAEIEIFKYIGSLIKTAENIMKIDTGGIDIGQVEIKELLKTQNKYIKMFQFLTPVQLEVQRCRCYWII